MTLGVRRFIGNTRDHLGSAFCEFVELGCLGLVSLPYRVQNRPQHIRGLRAHQTCGCEQFVGARRAPVAFAVRSERRRDFRGQLRRMAGCCLDDPKPVMTVKAAVYEDGNGNRNQSVSQTAILPPSDPRVTSVRMSDPRFVNGKAKQDDLVEALNDHSGFSALFTAENFTRETKAGIPCPVSANDDPPLRSLDRQVEQAVDRERDATVNIEAAFPTTSPIRLPLVLDVHATRVALGSADPAGPDAALLPKSRDVVNVAGGTNRELPAASRASKLATSGSSSRALTPSRGDLER